MSAEQLKTNEISRESGASNWLTTLPLFEKGVYLTKREFWDAVLLRYNWPLPRLPASCACGSAFTIQHALSCKKGGFVTQRHNEFRDLTANLLSEVCHDVQIEPPLNELTGESMTLKPANKTAEARLDVSARDVWTKGQRAFLDVRVFHLLARWYSGQSLNQCYITNEKEKKRAYNERVLQIENGTFTPLVFSVYGGMGRECKVFQNRLSCLLAEKRNEPYALVASWLRTKTSFALLRSCLICIRGSRHHF